MQQKSRRHLKSVPYKWTDHDRLLYFVFMTVLTQVQFKKSVIAGHATSTHQQWLQKTVTIEKAVPETESSELT
jgi:hypothetical protein